MMKANKRYQRFHPIVATVLVLSLVVTATTLAQGGEDLNSQQQEIDQTPIIVSEEVLDSQINTTVEIPIWQDTYVSSNNPNNNYCTSNWLRIGYSYNSPNNGAERLFLKFDLNSIPSEAAINWARFKIYMHSATPSPDPLGDMRVETRHLASDWSQCSVTWNNHQPDWGPVYGESWIGTNPGWLEFDVTDIVRDWVYGTHANYGLTVMGDENVRERQRMFYSSRETGGLYPRLIVDYEVHVDNEPPVVSVEPLPQWSEEEFVVRWSGYDPGGSGIAWYDVEWGISGGGWHPWLNHTTPADRASPPMTSNTRRTAAPFSTGYRAPRPRRPSPPVSRMA
jgi:hypothetical protein